jgi:hypothetical protein
MCWTDGYVMDGRVALLQREVTRRPLSLLGSATVPSWDFFRTELRTVRLAIAERNRSTSACTSRKSQQDSTIHPLEERNERAWREH